MKTSISNSSSNSHIRTYERSSSIVFLKTKEQFGGLSNMASGFPLRVNGVRIRTSEALYQACRFPHMPDVQQLIIEQASPMTAKMKGKPYRHKTRPDWESLRIKIMQWCLWVKLNQNLFEFGRLLLSTGSKPIVEESRKDSFWGAKPTGDELLIGMNVLGRLLMGLREDYKENPEAFTSVIPLSIPDFLLFGNQINALSAKETCDVNDTKPYVAQSNSYDKIKKPYNVSRQISLMEYLDDNGSANTDDTSELDALVEKDKYRSNSSTITTSLTSYDSYKPTPLPWLKEIPEHWDIRRNGRLFSQRNETGFPDLPILEVSLKTGVRVRDFQNSKRKQIMGDREKYKRAVAGDIAYNMMRMWQGAVGVAPEDGLISPAYVVAKPFPETDTHYYSYLFRTNAYKNEVNKYSHGIVSDRNRLYWDEFKQIPTPFPPTEEQHTITRYLKFKCHQIAKFTQTKRKLIARLNEQKQAIINQAVTRGLDPNVRLKPSGVDYLGDIPKHWVVKPLKHWARINAQTLTNATPEDFEFKYIDIGCVGTGFLSRRPETIKFYDAPSRARRILQYGDTLISMVRTYLRAVYYFGGNDGLTIASTGFAVLTPKKNVHPKMLGFAIQSDSFIDRVTANSIGIAYPAIPETKIGSLHIPLPPSQKEQLKVIHYIEKNTKSLSKAIDQTFKEIDLLREYRTRLTSDVVTGKLDVRNFEVEEMEPLEDVDDLDESEDAELLEEMDKNLDAEV